MESIETTDLFLGAVCLSLGYSVNHVKLRANGNRACFMFVGRGLNKLAADYASGNTVVNALKLKESLNRLRDTLFEKLKDNNEGRYIDDYARKNRPNQKVR